MNLIKTVTVGAGGTSAIDLTSIPATYTDLVIYFIGNVGVNITFNNSSTSYSYRKMYATGVSMTADASGSASSFPGAFGYYGGDVAVVGHAHIPNYAASTNKIINIQSVSERDGQAVTQYFGGMWANSSVIDSVQLSGGGATINQYSTVSIYGILKGSGGATVS